MVPGKKNKVESSLAIEKTSQTKIVKNTTQQHNFANYI